MTRLLVRVGNAGEARQAAEAGFDAVAFTVSRAAETGLQEALGAIRSVFPGTLRIEGGENIGVAALAELAMAVGADELALPADALKEAAFPPGKFELVARLHDVQKLPDLLAQLRDRAQAVALEFGRGAALFTETDIVTLDRFAAACRAHGLGFGIGGDIQEPDVARLLLLMPDTLALDATVRAGADRDGALTTSALEALRTLVPRVGTVSKAHRAETTTDRIFVRDFTLDMSIGAYHAELGRRQRVRFDVEVEVARDPKPPRDMRDVFSYDIITETIRMLARREHVAFVETLAEEIAGRLLEHTAVRAATVRVAKLDVIEGVVGIEIRRERHG